GRRQQLRPYPAVKILRLDVLGQVGTGVLEFAVVPLAGPVPFLVPARRRTVPVAGLEAPRPVEPARAVPVPRLEPTRPVLTGLLEAPGTIPTPVLEPTRPILTRLLKPTRPIPTPVLKPTRPIPTTL